MGSGSFYGQVLYEFTKLFSKFCVKLNNSSEEPVEPYKDNSTSTVLDADTIWEQLHFEPKNHWIQLRTGKKGNGEKIIEIGHSSPGKAVQTEIKNFEHIDKIPDKATCTTLKGGEYISTSKLSYDKAGHLNNLENIYYKLPVPTISVQTNDKDVDIIPDSTNDKLSFTSDMQWITMETDDSTLKFKHTIKEKKDLTADDYNNFNSFDRIHPSEEELNKEEFIESMETIDHKSEEEINAMRELLENFDENMTISVLSPGDLIATSDTTKDLNGHIIDNEIKYFKLPVSPTDLNFADHTNRIEELEKRLESGTLGEKPDTIEYGAYEDIVETVLNTQAFLSAVTENYETIDKLTGELNDIYFVKDSQDNLITKSIIDTIGPVNGTSGYSAKIYGLEGKTDDAKNPYSVSQALIALVNKINDIGEDIKGIQSRLTIIENKLEISTK